MSGEGPKDAPVLDTSSAPAYARRIEAKKPDLLLTEEHQMCPGCGEPLAVRQHHRAHCGGNEQRRGDLEGEDVAGEQQLRERRYVAIGGTSLAREPARGDAAQRPRKPAAH